MICKVTERIMRRQVFSFLDQKGCLNTTQHGFMPGRSCLSALLDVFDNIMIMYILLLLDSNSSVDMALLTCYLQYLLVVVRQHLMGSQVLTFCPPLRNVSRPSREIDDVLQIRIKFTLEDNNVHIDL